MTEINLRVGFFLLSPALWPRSRGTGVVPRGHLLWFIISLLWQLLRYPPSCWICSGQSCTDTSVPRPLCPFPSSSFYEICRHQGVVLGLRTMLGRESLWTFASGSCCHLLLLQGLPRVPPGKVAQLLQPPDSANICGHSVIHSPWACLR